MAIVGLKRLGTVLSVWLLANFATVLAVPTPYEELGHEAREILARATPAAPHWVVYSDYWLDAGAPPTSLIDVSVRSHEVIEARLIVLPRDSMSC